MPKYSKEYILNEIRKSAEDNGGLPLGVDRFAKETNIKPHDWQKYWARFGDAIKEAGFESNKFGESYSIEFLAEKIIKLIRKLGKFPTKGELIVAHNQDDTFPSERVFGRFGKKSLADKIIEYCNTKTGYDDVIIFCQAVPEKKEKHEVGNASNTSLSIGEVYLYKSGKFYKIGRTKDTVRRGTELRIQLAEEPILVHSIKTDDPPGIEAYWHKRFENKRKNGEWFDLNRDDVKAFMRWKRIV
jgi:hypothetical protein